MENKSLVASERFANNVLVQYSSEVGNNSFTDYQQKLAQHLFIKIDYSMKELKKNDSKGNYKDLDWNTINMSKLAIDSVNRIQLGLDGLINGHVYPICYKNHKSGKYDIDLRIGYKGELIYRQKTSLHEIKNIRVELVYSNDKFIAIKKDGTNPVETYIFEVSKNAFDRGEIVGGFGYVEFDDESKNFLEIVSKKEIDKSKTMAMSDKFWGKFYDDMAYKTIVRKTVSRIEVDPEKINKAYFIAENSINEEIQNKNEEQVIEIEDEEIPLMETVKNQGIKLDEVKIIDPRISLDEEVIDPGF